MMRKLNAVIFHKWISFIKIVTFWTPRSRRKWINGVSQKCKTIFHTKLRDFEIITIKRILLSLHALLSVQITIIKRTILKCTNTILLLFRLMTIIKVNRLNFLVSDLSSARKITFISYHQSLMYGYLQIYLAVETLQKRTGRGNDS